MRIPILNYDMRVTGKRRDDLQETIAMLRQLKGLEVALQFDNFRF